MRIRSIKPEFWRSSDISGLVIEDRLLFIGLWSYVDDNGVGLDKLSAITADLFADDLERDPSDTFARVSRGLQHLSSGGRILRYTLENVDYLSIVNWSKHQRIDRPGKARLPQYDAEFATIREGVASLPVNVSPGSGNRGSGNRGTEEQGTGEQNTCSPATPTSERPTRFEEFWEHYPRKVGKDKAKTKYVAATKRADEQTIIDGATRLASDPNLPEKKYIPHPTTWLERGSWDDEPLPARWDTPKSEQRLQQGLELVHRATSRQPAQPTWELPSFENQEIEQ